MKRNMKKYDIPQRSAPVFSVAILAYLDFGENALFVSNLNGNVVADLGLPPPFNGNKTYTAGLKGLRPLTGGRKSVMYSVGDCSEHELILSGVDPDLFPCSKKRKAVIGMAAFDTTTKTQVRKANHVITGRIQNVSRMPKTKSVKIRVKDD